jgi:D-beta-D-heptose 7-phosphate kinase/D-beta-D-heptose 1-phosphate adenosyltransferase
LVDRTRLADIAGRFPGKRVLVVGDVMLDEYVWGRVERISPEAPVPVVEVRTRSYVPGGAANTAANVASLRGQALLGSVAGRDAAGERLQAALRERGVDVSGFDLAADRSTTCKTRIVAHEQHVVRVDCEQRRALTPSEEDSLLSWAGERMAGVEACILSDYAKGLASPRLAQGLIARARAANKPIVVDPKPADFVKYRGATVVKPNLTEVERICNLAIDGERRLAEAGDRLCGMLEGSAVMITRGSLGISLFRPGEPPVHVPAISRQVFDVTGAGDTVAGAVAMALAAGASLEEAAHLGNHCAGIAVGKVGTYAVGLDELLVDA